LAGISLGPIASGLPKDLVQRLVDAEREPIRQLEARKANEESRLKLVQDLSAKVQDVGGSIKDLTRFRSFRDLMAVNPKPEIMDVSVDKNTAEPGTYQLEVMQLAGRASMISNGFSDPDEVMVGSGYFAYTLPNGEEKEVYIAPEESSLNAMAKTINSQRGLGLKAIVVDDGSLSEEPFRLIVSHEDTGTINDAEFPSFYFLDGDEDFYLEQDKEAKNAIVKVNGFEVEFEGNKVTTLLPGVSLDLREAAPGKEFTLKIQEDTKSVAGKVEAVVQKLNEVLGFIQNQNKLDKDSNTRNTLGGDITLQTLEFKLRQLVKTPLETESGPVRMADLGIVFARNGLLEFNPSRLEKTLNENFEAVSQFFVGIEDAGDGFARKLGEASMSLTRPEGVVSSRIDGIRRRISDIDRQIETKERQIANTERQLKDKFAKLEGTITKMKAQQSSVQGALGGASLLPNLG
jgi:flagellar hook-associated protein 2